MFSIEVISTEFFFFCYWWTKLHLSIENNILIIVANCSKRQGGVEDYTIQHCTQQDFDDEEPTDSCTQLAPSYKGNTFVTNALQNSRFAISWDQTDPKRKQVRHTTTTTTSLCPTKCTLHDASTFL